MKKVCCLLLALLLAAGCAARPETAPAEGHTFTDDLGRTVTVTSCQRTASLLGSYTDIWLLAGGQVCATVDDAWDDLNLPLDADCVNLGAVKEPDLELLLASEPDFVIASTNTQRHLDWQQTLESAGVTVAYFDVADFDGYLRMLKTCTELTGCPDRYEQYGAALQPRVEAAIAEGQERPVTTVLSLRASASSIRAKNSEGNVLGEMLRDLGAVNIADSDSGLLEDLSMESILAADPDKIFIVQSGNDAKGTEAAVEELLAQPAWQELTAVREGRVYMLDKLLYNLKPNARWAEAYENLEELLEQ